MTTLTLQVGRTYRAKRPAPAGIGYYNDRTILHIGAMGDIQYDGPAVAFGRHYPKVTRQKFEEWAGEDVTDKLPPGEWERWGGK